jgi:NADPH-ferrihemoprotein reductase
MAADLSDYDPETLCNISETKIAIFLISTYGEGDPSDNATQLISWLHANSNINFPISLSNLRYAAFGLGNSNYKFYNRVVDTLTAALDRFHAKALLPTGRADDAKDATEEDFAEWKQGLFSVFSSQLHLEERPQEYEPSIKVVEDPSLDQIDLHVGEPIRPQSSKKITTISSSIQPLKVAVARPLLDTTERNCLHVEIDTTEYPDLKYKTGDHLAVWPSNPTSEINRLITVLGLQERRGAHLLISNIDPSIPTKVPSPTNLDALFGHYLEICGRVPRETVLSLAQFATSPSSKDFLTRLGASKDVYKDYCATNHVTLARILEAAISPAQNWSHLPLSFILEILQPLQPRRYSISSSSAVSPHTIALTMSTTTPTLSSGQTLPLQISGLTTGYLTALSQTLQSPQSSDYNLEGPNKLLGGNKIFASVSPSKFRLPVLPKHPLILVASGSGIAPFRGFLQERARLARLGHNVGPVRLFFGCRSAAEFLYSNELATLQTEMGETLEIITAFSRSGEKKIYVQHRVQERVGEIVDQLCNENGYFYICGSAAMAREVGAVVGEGLKNKMGWSDIEFRDWVKRGRRWQEDVWG